jgi:predicted transposase YdaD
MRESAFMNEVRADGRAEGEAKGRAEGRAEGEAKGITQGERRALLLVLGQRFGVRVPTDLAAALDAQSDADVLSQWLTHAVTAKSLKAFRGAIAR